MYGKRAQVSHPLGSVKRWKLRSRCQGSQDGDELKQMCEPVGRGRRGHKLQVLACMTEEVSVSSSRPCLGQLCGKAPKENRKRRATPATPATPATFGLAMRVLGPELWQCIGQGEAAGRERAPAQRLPTTCTFLVELDGKTRLWVGDWSLGALHHLASHLKDAQRHPIPNRTKSQSPNQVTRASFQSLKRLNVACFVAHCFIVNHTSFSFSFFLFFISFFPFQKFIFRSESAVYQQTKQVSGRRTPSKRGAPQPTGC